MKLSIGVSEGTHGHNPRLLFGHHTRNVSLLIGNRFSHLFNAILAFVFCTAFLDETGEIGPDSTKVDPERGPTGFDEVNKASSPGNYGWPYCIADNKSYNMYDFNSGQSGAEFDCSQPKNLSPNNNGATLLPEARSGFVWYSKKYNGPTSDEEAVPDGQGNTATAPYMHKHDPTRFGECALPECK